MQTNPSHENATRDAGTDKLQELLRTELSAVETYELALRGITHVGLHKALQEILSSHAQRADRLRHRIGRLGTEPAESSGVWGAFAKAIQAGADLLGDRTAIAALEQGEDRALELYRTDVASYDMKTQKLIENELLPDQQRTHDLCKTLKTYMQAPS